MTREQEAAYITRIDLEQRTLDLKRENDRLRATVLRQHDRIVELQNRIDAIIDLEEKLL